MLDVLSINEINRIRTVGHFKDSKEAREDIGALYIFYVTNFVELLNTYELTRPPRVIADIGTGYGWLAIALARRTNARVIAIDTNEARLVAARQIAAILGVEHRIDWIVSSLPELSLIDQEADVTFCLEVIEHVGISPSVVQELGRVTRELLVISSPNRNFPVIGHDTKLPFCHWLPLPIRDRYATFFRRMHLQDNNFFWSPGMISAALLDFGKESRFLQFRSYRDFCDARNRAHRHAPTYGSKSRAAVRCWLWVVALFGAQSVHLLPNLASTFRRKSGII